MRPASPVSRKPLKSELATACTVECWSPSKELAGCLERFSQLAADRGVTASGVIATICASLDWNAVRNVYTDFGQAQSALRASHTVDTARASRERFPKDEIRAVCAANTFF